MDKVTTRTATAFMVALCATILGVADLVLTLALGFGWSMALVALAWGAVSGAMLGSWLAEMGRLSRRSRRRPPMTSSAAAAVIAGLRSEAV